MASIVLQNEMYKFPLYIPVIISAIFLTNYHGTESERNKKKQQFSAKRNHTETRKKLGGNKFRTLYENFNELFGRNKICISASNRKRSLLFRTVIHRPPLEHFHKGKFYTAARRQSDFRCVFANPNLAAIFFSRPHFA